MKLRIMTPMKVVFEGEVREIYLPGSIGEFGVLPDHAEMITALGTGICRFTKQDGNLETLTLNQGVCHVFNNEVKVLTESLGAHF